MQQPVPVPEVDVQTAARHQRSGAPLIDVREPDEFEEVHADGARLVPLGDLPDRLHELAKDTTTYLICRSGARSMRAAEFLAAQGFDVANVAGGTQAWVAAGLPVEHGR